MRRATDHADRLSALRPRIVYTDLDGTLLGPGGSLFAGPQAGVTVRAAQALAALHTAGTAVVPLSGRTEDQVREVARVIGATGFIAELGGIVHTGTEIVRRYGAFQGPGTPYQAMARTGAAGFLLEAFAGQLEPHAPWAFRGRECTMLLRGRVETAAARQALADAGYGWLDLVDNGRIAHPGPTPVVHAYHLAPMGVTKADAVAEDLARRGITGDRAVAVGDGPSDAAVAEHVAAVLVVANGVEPVEDAGPPAENVYAMDGEWGEGFAEVVLSLVGAS